LAKTITAPDQFFGFRLGSDRQIARWDKVIAYFNRLADESDRIKVSNLGPSTEGNPFLLVTISSPANLARLEHYRAINLKLSDPRGLDAAAVAGLVDEGKVVICQSMSLHATEIGGTQMAPELAYDLLSGDDEDTVRILDNVILLMVPCFNPDGQLMVTDWYNEWRGTEYEGSNYPRLYHKYVGHDNNRDALTQNMIEAKYMAEILFRQWRPQAYLDHHHQGSEAARFNIPPYSDPIHPNGDPIVWQEINWYGAHMGYALEAAGKAGVLHSARYEGWGHLGFHWITIYHNIAGMLTESASAKLATPLFVHPEQLVGASPKTMPDYAAQTNFPNPWPGGWWRLRDIVEQQKISAWALLDIAARCRATILANVPRKALRQTERGRLGTPKSYVLPADQHDPLTAAKLLQALHNQGIEVHVAEEAFTVGHAVYPAGTHVVPLAQPKAGLVKTLLGRTYYPDSYWTRTADGTPIVRDYTTDTIAEFMGVEVVPVDEEISGSFALATAPPKAAGIVATGAAGLAFDARLNDSHKVANRLLAKGVRVFRTAEALETAGCCDALPPGSFYLPADAADRSMLTDLAAETGVGFQAVPAAPKGLTELKPKRIGLFQRYWSGNIDEGWTRFVLERFEFPYRTVMDADISSGKLGEMVDILILPSDSREMMLGPLNHMAKDSAAFAQIKRFGNCPPAYRSGFGIDGMRAIGDFVAGGGKLVAMDHAAKLAIEACGLNIRIVTDGLPTKRYLTKGATLWAMFDTADPLAYGMPERALIQSVDSAVFATAETFTAEQFKAVATYPSRDLLQSGWLIGEDLLVNKVALLHAKAGQGEVVLIGFRCQNRAQTHGTFKVLFNALR